VIRVLQHAPQKERPKAMIREMVGESWSIRKAGKPMGASAEAGKETSHFGTALAVEQSPEVPVGAGFFAGFFSSNRDHWPG